LLLQNKSQIKSSGNLCLGSGVWFASLVEVTEPRISEMGLMPKSRTLIADNNPDMLEVTSQILKDSFDIVGAFLDGNAVMREYRGLRPEVFVLDISMGDVNGIDIAEQLRDVGCAAPIIFLTVHEDHDFVRAAFGAGGSGYVVKSRLCLDLVSAIRAAQAGELFVSPSLLYDPGTAIT
jgi:DNA-binding NarL/FixJ family response regulator